MSDELADPARRKRTAASCQGRQTQKGARLATRKATHITQHLCGVRRIQAVRQSADAVGRTVEHLCDGRIRIDLGSGLAQAFGHALGKVRNAGTQVLLASRDLVLDRSGQPRRLFGGLGLMLPCSDVSVSLRFGSLIVI